MAILAARNISKSFGERLLFDGVTFELNEKDKVGLVGSNGSGKSTLFRILLDEESASSGEIFKQRDLSIVSMEQIIADKDKTIYEVGMSCFEKLIDIENELEQINSLLNDAQGKELEELINRQHSLNTKYEQDGGLTFRSRVRSTLLGLGFSEDELNQPISKISGGQQNKVQLASVLLSGASLLLLDEPTNHLDIESILWLEDFLKNYSGAYIVISHDRYFLDVVTNRTMEFKNTHFYLTNGNYSRHYDLMADEQEHLRRKYVNTQKEIRRIEGIIEQQKRWGREKNIKTAQSKQKQVEKLKATLVAPEKESYKLRFRFDADFSSGNDILMVSNLKKSFNKPVFSNVDMHIRKGERIFLYGPNGCGKTTLLKILMGLDYADEGTFQFGAKVRPGYYEQHMTSLHSELNIIEEIRETYPQMDDSEIRGALGVFLFKGDDTLKTISKLSGGEKARVQLLKLMLSGVNFLILDEPTNHLDISSRDALERALEDFGGTMLIVSHDRYLIDRLADRLLVFSPNGLDEYLGGYSYYLEQKSNRSTLNADFDDDELSKEPLKKNDYRLQKEKQSAINRANGLISRIEEKIQNCESEIDSLMQQLSLPDIATDYQKSAELSALVESLKSQSEELYIEWEEAQENLNTLLSE